MNRKWIALFIPVLGLASCSSTGKNTLDDKSKGKDDDPPSLTSPQTRRMWIPDKIEGEQYIKGHYIYYIEKGAQWKAQ